MLRLISTLLFTCGLIGCSYEIYKRDTGRDEESAPADGGDGGSDGFGGQPSTSVTSGSSGGADPTGEWTSAVGSLLGRSVPCAFAVLSPTPDGESLLAGIEGDAVWKRDLTGDAWEGLGLSGLSDRIEAIPASFIYDPDDEDTFWISSIYGWGLYRTTNAGETFERVGELRHSDHASFDFDDPERKTIVAGGHERRKILSLSRDGGATWQSIGENLPEECGWSSAPHVIDRDTFLLGCTDGIARTTNGGKDWEYVSDVGGTAPPLVATDGSIYWAAMQGIARSTDQGESWELLAGETPFWPRTPLELPDGRLAASGRNAVLISDDHGETWETLSARFPFTPRGIVYSATAKAFFVWRLACEDAIGTDEILQYTFDYEAE